MDYEFPPELVDLIFYAGYNNSIYFFWQERGLVCSD